MKSKITIILLVLSLVVNAQKRAPAYRLPEGIQKSQYSQVSVLVKWKESHAPASNGRIGLSVPGVSINKTNALAPAKLASRASSWRGPRKSSVDINRYSRISLNIGQDIETVINKLYATGHFEIVEPEFVDQMSFNPNDQSIGQQYYLDLINAYEAWDITQGSTDVVIAIIDSGGDLDHPDLAGNLYTNPDEIPGDGVDNDGDEFIDNVNGWDFVGDDIQNIYNSNFIGDNNPQLNLTEVGVLTHGVWVAGCASASANNAVGIAGVGFKSKLLFTKHTADNQAPDDLSLYFGYDGILYAAATLAQDNVSRKIINCSWGGTFRSQIAQDIINYVTLDLGCLVVGAAGNANSQANHYPSSYDNVLSVAATDQSDVKASFSNTGYTVDICAPGVAIYTTEYDNLYGSVQGTSFSCPIVSGAAALVWAHYPNMSAPQISELIRVTADATIYTKNSSASADKLGKGRLDIQKALTAASPSIRVTNPVLQNAQGGFAEPGQPAMLSVDFTNFLIWPSTDALSVTISSSSPYVTISSNAVNLGVIGENEKVGRSFPLTINTAAPENLVVNIKFSFSDSFYSDFQVISYNVNPSFADIDENKVTTTISSRGRLGFDDPENQSRGSGFVFNENQILYEMGLITGTSSTSIFNNVRGSSGNFEQDFTLKDRLREQTPGERSTSEIYGSFINASSLSTATTQIDYRSLVRKDAPFDQFVIYEYKVKNVSASTINDYRFGIFADWDISDFGGGDAADWNADRKLGYIYPRGSTDLPHAGIQVLNQPANYYAIDNSETISGNPFGLYDGYTDEEKFTSLSTERLVAGTTTAEGNDVSHVVSAGPFTIAAGETVTIAFAVHAASNLTELLTSADNADLLYNEVFQYSKPEVNIDPICFGSSATLNATGAANYSWYTQSAGGDPIATGPQFITSALMNDTVFYVANTDNTFESIRTRAEIILRAKPFVTFTGSLSVCSGETVTLTAEGADQYSWSPNGEITQSVEASTTGSYSVTVRDNSLDCQFTSETYEVVVNPLPEAAFIASTNSVTAYDPVTFTDASTNAASWSWNFGDNQSSTMQNPVHTYYVGGGYTVTLTVTDANGCKDSFTDLMDVITSTEKELEAATTVYPNPVRENIRVEITGLNSPYFNVQLTNAQGQSLYAGQAESANGKFICSIPSSKLSQGIYYVKIFNESGVIIRKIIKID